MLVKSVENIVNVQTVQIVHEILHKKKNTYLSYG